MKKFKILSDTAILTLLLMACALVAFCQEDMETVHDSAFTKKIRPPVAFFHDTHNEKAGLDDCAACHHAYADGKQLAGEDSIGMECSECHYGKPGDGIPDLIRAYHLQCGGCHRERKAGPVLCGECHRRE